MNKKIMIGVALLAFMALFIALTPHEQAIDSNDMLPWNITHPTTDAIRVMGITLGLSTLTEAEQNFKQTAEISIFKSADSKIIIEARFQNINPQELKANVTLTMEIPSFELPGLFSRSSHMNSAAAASGQHFTLIPDDLLRVRSASILSLRYLADAPMNEAYLIKHFGNPAKRVRDTKSGEIHWLYPQLGLDITLNANEKPLLEFLQSTDFELQSTSLLAQGEILK